MMGAPPKVFISYSHDTVEHQERVLGLADRLRAEGIDAEVDQYNAAPPDGWPLWCERQIGTADVVLMICTETYHRRIMGNAEQGRGLGVVWEARIIRQLLYDAGAISNKFVPVLFSDTSPEQIPTPIKGWTRYVVDTEDGYEELYRRLTSQPRLLRPTLGTIRPMPARRRQWSEGTMQEASSPDLKATQKTGSGRMEPVVIGSGGQATFIRLKGEPHQASYLPEYFHDIANSLLKRRLVFFIGPGINFDPDNSKMRNRLPPNDIDVASFLAEDFSVDPPAL